MKCIRTLSGVLCLLIGAGLVAQGRTSGKQATTPKQLGTPRQAGKANKLQQTEKPGKLGKPGKPGKLGKRRVEKSDRDLAKKLMKDFAAKGGLVMPPAPRFGPGFIGGWQPAQPWTTQQTWIPATPGMVDRAYQIAFRKLQAAQSELAAATTPEKARKALDKIQKATMQVRRALWKAEKAGRKLRPRPATSVHYPILGGIRPQAAPPKVKSVLIPTVVHSVVPTVVH